MKKLMLILIIVLLLLNGLLNVIWHRDRAKEAIEIENRLDKLDSILQHRSQLDSLYWNHLEECAFELKKELKYSKHN